MPHAQAIRYFYGLILSPALKNGTNIFFFTQYETNQNNFFQNGKSNPNSGHQNISKKQNQNSL